VVGPSPARWVGQLSGWSREELGARLTFLTLLFAPVGDWYVRPAVMSLAALGLLFSDLWRSRWLWTVLTLLTAVRVIQDWPMADNHAYLLAYWCLAFAVALWAGDRESVARNARLLIGLTFALAAWQKGTSPDYANDVFFLTTFILDDRFEDFTVLFTSMTYDQLDAARAYLEADYRAGVYPLEPRRADAGGRRLPRAPRRPSGPPARPVLAGLLLRDLRRRTGPELRLAAPRDGGVPMSRLAADPALVPRCLRDPGVLL